MRRRTLLALLPILALLAGCGKKAVDAPAIAPPPPPEQTAEILATEPLWPRYGLELNNLMSVRYKSAPVGGAELVPLSLGSGIYFQSRKDDAVYLAGEMSEHHGLTLLKQPRLLYKLPLRVGDQWEIAGLTCKADGTEQLPSPAGAQKAVRVICSAGTREDHREFWVPGYGAVRWEFASGREPATASAAQEITPAEAPPVGHPAPGVTALVLDEGSAIRVSAGGPDLYQEQPGSTAVTFQWLPNGGTDLLLRQVPGPTGGLQAFAYNHKTGRLDRVNWQSDRGQVTEVHGTWGVGADGSLKLYDTTVYPARSDIWRYGGTAMVADPAAKTLTRAATAPEFVHRLFGLPALPRDNFVAQFAQTMDGENLWQLMRSLTVGGQLPTEIVELPAPRETDPSIPASYHVLLGEKKQKVLVQVKRDQDDWRVVTVGYPQ